MKSSTRWLAATVVALLGIGWWWMQQDGASTAAPGRGVAGPSPVAALQTPASGSPTGPDFSGRAALEARYNRAAQTYTSYRDSTRYPPGSRPLRDHPDQGKPFAAIGDERVLLTGTGKVAKGIKLRTSQERFYLNDGESVDFKLEALDENGAHLPVVIKRSSAFNMAETKDSKILLQAPISFTDDGTGPDLRARDGVYSARLTPATQGFAEYAGTIRVAAEIDVRGEAGELSFDVVYTGGVPAVWLSSREALESGSLNFYLKAKVALPGRYVVSGRVFDANDSPVGLLQYNEEVPAGIREFKLQLFGALVMDSNPVFPLRLVDVEGFLLKPDVFPDRAMMARKSGTVLTTGSYKRDQFSSAEWTSEERTRYLNEFRSDLIRAEAALKAASSP